MKKFRHLLDRPWFAYTVAACAAVTLYVLFGYVGTIKTYIQQVLNLLSPVVIGAIVAYLFNPLSEWFEKKLFSKVKNEEKKQAGGVIITVLVMIIFLGVLLGALIPSIIKSVISFIDSVRPYIDMIFAKNDAEFVKQTAPVFEWVNGILSKFGKGFESIEAAQEEVYKRIQDTFSNLNLTEKVSEIFSKKDDGFQKTLESALAGSKSIIATVGTGIANVTNFLLGIIFGFCFLIAKDPIVSFVDKIRRAAIPERRIKRHNEILSRCNHIFIRYVGCTLLDAFIIGVCTLIFCLVMKVPFAVLIAVICAVTNIIPTFGPWIGSLLSMSFIVLAGHPWKALWFFIFSCIIQTLDGMLVKPILFKDSLGIPAVWTLILIVIGGKLGGIAGIILAIPFAAMFVIIYRETVVPRLEKRKKKINAEAAGTSKEDSDNEEPEEKQNDETEERGAEEKGAEKKKDASKKKSSKKSKA